MQRPQPTTWTRCWREIEHRCTCACKRWVANFACAAMAHSSDFRYLPPMRCSPLCERRPEALPSTHVCGPSIVLLCSHRLSNTAHRPLKTLETFLDRLQTWHDRLEAAVLALLDVRGSDSLRPLVAGLSAGAAVVYVLAAAPLLEAVSVRAARRHAAPARVGGGASTGSLPQGIEGGDGSASWRDLGEWRLCGPEALPALARAVMFESAGPETSGHAGGCVEFG